MPPSLATYVQLTPLVKRDVPEPWSLVFVSICRVADLSVMPLEENERTVAPIPVPICVQLCDGGGATS